MTHSIALKHTLQSSVAILLGHRGSNRVHLENTMPAFEAALQAGLHGIELDVQRTKDGVLVVHHDFHLPNGELIAALNFNELHLPEPYTVPKLEQVLTWAKQSGAYLNIEIKLETFTTDGREKEVAALVERSGMGQQIIISSFNPISLWRIKRFAPSLETALLFYNSKKNWVLDHGYLAFLLGVSAIHPHHSQVTLDMVLMAHRMGWKVNVWTVNEPETVQKLLKLGVDGIIGDEPKVLLDGTA
jgi:glycerophosphoryl diester phosphodiesterase